VNTSASEEDFPVRHQEEFRARCSCLWSGLPRDNRDEALKDSMAHCKETGHDEPEEIRAWREEKRAEALAAKQAHRQRRAEKNK